MSQARAGEAAISTWVQIAMANSSNATANRRLGCRTSSSGSGQGRSDLLDRRARHSRAEPWVEMQTVGQVKDRRPPGEMIPVGFAFLQ